MRSNHAHEKKIGESAVLVKAFKNILKKWQINQALAGQMIGFKQARISQLINGSADIEIESKEGESMILVVRAFRALDALMGGNEENQRRWLNSHNDALNGKPLDLMLNMIGLVRVVQYLDAMRGKI